MLFRYRGHIQMRHVTEKMMLAIAAANRTGLDHSIDGVQNIFCRDPDFPIAGEGT